MSNQPNQWNYPSTKTTENSDTYFGVTIQDPYRWLEDLKNTEVTDWFRSQAKYCENVLNRIPNRDKLVQEMTELDKVRKVNYRFITEREGNFFFIKRLPGEEIYKLYYRESENGEDVLLFDPSLYEPGRTYTIGGLVPSDDGKKILLDITESGKEISFIKILDIESKKFFPDELKISYSNDWISGSDNIFIYTVSQEDDIHKMESYRDMKVMVHKIGDPVSKDKEILSRINNPELQFTPEDIPYIVISKNCNYIFAGKGSVDNNVELYYGHRSQLNADKIDWKPLCKKSEEITGFVANKDDIYLLTSKNSTNFKILKTSLKNPDIANAKEIFSGKDKKIESINSTKDYLIISQIHNGIESYISKMNFNSAKIEPVDMPLKGTISLIPNNPFSNECIVFNSNWTTPYNLYSINLENNNFRNGAFYIESEYAGIENIISEEVEVESHDGIMVPLSIYYDKSKHKKDGSNICYIEGYGAYGASMNPFFNPYNLPLIKRGVIFAIAHVRGGGEKGDDWHKAGMKTTKSNTWKDFIACAEYLINMKYTSKDRLTGTGTSAGGILIGKAITDRPDLFRAAVPKVSDLNSLRGEFIPSGPANIPEFGTVTIEEEFRGLMEMDAYFHLREGEKYPATLITTGFNDPRVTSWMPAKFAAKMQNINASDNPVLLYVDYSTGHFGGETTSSRFKNFADIYAFILWQCGHPDFQPKDNGSI